MSKHLIRLGALSALLVAGSCAAPGPDNYPVTTVDPDRTHPITVQPDYRVAKVSYMGGSSLAPEDAAMVDKPRDLEESRRLDDAPDATRRAVVMSHYEKGESSQAVKKTYDSTTEQSAPGAGIGN